MRSCVHDAFCHAASELNVEFGRQQIFAKLTPKQKNNSYITDVGNCFRGKLYFYKTIFDKMKGGGAFNLLKVKDQGVFLVEGEAQGDDGSKTKYCFIYNSFKTEKDNASVIGAIIYNRDTAATRFVKDEDRADKCTARAFLDSFFKCKFMVRKVYEITDARERTE